MTSESDKDQPKDGANGADPGDAAQVTFSEPDVETPGSTKAPESAAVDPLEAAKADAQKFRDQLLRTAADFDNFRKRARRDQEDAARKGKEQSVKELLPVFDNLERAIQSSEKAPDVKAVIDGLKLVMRQFGQSLEKMGIKRVATVGIPFDPTQHEAIQHIESTEYAPGVVAAEVQAGYILGTSTGDQLLRAALVVVSKGPPEGAAAAPAGEGEPS
jgi:molecular chaperone GrpE